MLQKGALYVMFLYWKMLKCSIRYVKKKIKEWFQEKQSKEAWTYADGMSGIFTKWDVW